MRRLLLSVFVLVAPGLRAATYIVPTDIEMLHGSDDVVIATALAARAERTETGGIVTKTTLVIEEVLKGDRAAGQELVLTERGGRVDGLSLFVSGAPRYEPGRRYLVFTESNADGDPITFGLSLGRFVLEGELAVREGITGFDQNLEPHIEQARDAREFIAFLRSAGRRVPGAGPWPASSTDRLAPSAQHPVPAITGNAIVGLTRAGYLYDGAYRWEGVPDAAFVLSGAIAGGSDAAQRGVTEWNATETNIAYRIAGQDDTALGGLTTPDGRNAILFGDPKNEVPSSAAAQGGVWGTDEYTFAGETFTRILEADVVFNHPFSPSLSCLYTVMTHELGHTLGIRHANHDGRERPCPQSLDCASDAVMRAAVTCALDGRLRPWDERAAAAVYGAGPPPLCETPSLTSYSGSTTVARGTPVTLTMTATGSAPLTLQWYRGARGDRSQPAGSGATVTVTPEATTTYWARAGNACGHASSELVTITVQAARKRRAVGRS